MVIGVWANFKFTTISDYLVRVDVYIDRFCKNPECEMYFPNLSVYSDKKILHMTF